MALTKHFRREEFDCDDGTTVPDVAIPALIALCVDVLEPLRDEFGPCAVLSGYRHRAYNAKIGGARYSQHIYDDTPASVAADARFMYGNPRQWRRAAHKAMRKAYGVNRFTRRRKMGGVGLYVRSNFVHVDNRLYRAEWRGN